MTTKDIKLEIQKSLDNVPEEVLQDVLEYLRQLQLQPTNKASLIRNFRDILIEDKVLLERLAK